MSESTFSDVGVNFQMSESTLSDIGVNSQMSESCLSLVDPAQILSASRNLSLCCVVQDDPQGERPEVSTMLVIHSLGFFG